MIKDGSDGQHSCTHFISIIKEVYSKLPCNIIIPYSAYISQVFNFANFTSLESFAKLIQRIF